MSLVLAFDQSTSSTKAVLFHPTGRVVAKCQREHSQLYPSPGWVEHDAEEIWENVLTVARELGDLDEVGSVSITNQRETVVVFDRKTGKPLHNAIVWQCQRGSELCRELCDRGYEASIRDKTGLKLDTYFSASKLAWLMRNEPRVAERLRDGSAAIGTMDAYLVHRLTGGAVFATDITNASRTLLFDVRALSWDESLCELFSVPACALPEVRESTARFGDTDLGGLLPRRVPIVGVMGDSQASFFAQRCYAPGETKATFGTGTSVLMNVGNEFKLNDAAVTALAFAWEGRVTYAFEGLIHSSAATIAWFKNQLGLIESEHDVEALAGSVPDSGGVYLVPAFAGLGAPHWSTAARAAILGITAFSRKAHVVRAGLESIAYQLRDVLEAMRIDAVTSPPRLFCDGGPTQNRLLMQLIADLTGITLEASEVAECSAWGAAASGLLGLGFYASLEALAQLPRETRVFRPVISRAEADRRYDGWSKAVARVL